MASPWKKIEPLEPVSLSEIMSEEYAKDLQTKYSPLDTHLLTNESPKSASCKDSDPLDISLSGATSQLCALDDFQETSSDAVIAEVMQHQFDGEYNEYVNRYENKMNGTSNVKVSFKNYLRQTYSDDDDSDEETDQQDLDCFDSVLRKMNMIPACGYMKQADGNMVTKHDIKLCGQMNMLKVMQFDKLATGDGGAYEYSLSNKVFNSLKSHMLSEQNRKPKVHEKKEHESTEVLALNFLSKYQIYKLITSGLVKTCEALISSGKESVILYGTREETEELPIKECALKVYKMSLSRFKNRGQYIKDDFRFKDKMGKQNMRKVLTLWAEKEKQNLLRMRKYGIPCPNVVAAKHNILVMSFIGENGVPAPNLINAKLKPKDAELAYSQICTLMKNLYTNANLIHADLSAYNILWYQKQCYLIDVGQALIPTSTEHYNYLFRDCYNITQHFKRMDISNVLSPDELFASITGTEYTDKVLLEEKLKPHHLNNPEHEASDAQFL